tara:strand:- start:90 stop:314 length:225 start_codon:yes stop_codon:yes gene_type:complete
MKILITLLLTLFISGQAYALSSTEVIAKGKIISMKAGDNGTVYIVLYKKEFFRCSITSYNINCIKPKDRNVEYN